MTSPHLGRIIRLLAVLLAFCLTASCGISLDESPREIADDQLDEELKLAEAPEAVVQPQFDAVVFFIYLIDEEGRLRAVERELPLNSRPQDLILSLLDGPSADESEANLSTALAADLAVRNVTNSGSGTVILDIGSGAELSSLSTSEQRVAIGQLVYTVTGLLTVSSFRLQINGENVSVPTDGDDASADEPVSRDDYASLAPLEDADTTDQ